MPNKTWIERFREIIEICADLEHERWSKWYRWQRDNSTPENIERWNRQEKTLYKDLSEEDKEKDRMQVYPYAEIIKHFISELLKEEREKVIEEIKSKIPKESRSKWGSENMSDYIHWDNGFNQARNEILEILNNLK